MSLALFINFLALCFSFFVAGVLVGVIFSPPLRKAIREVLRPRARRDIALAKVLNNPILQPGAYPWTAEAVLNPAAFMLGERVHLLYRAVGGDGVSRLGYASSANGIVFDERLPYPVYAAMNPRSRNLLPQRYSPVLYPSGGSWGGCEDPRAVVIDGRVYVTFNMFDGWDFIRIGLISIAIEDLLAKRFSAWRGPQLLSPPGERHKNWVLFPEKINGTFAILHNLHCDEPDRVRIEYIDDLERYDPAKHHFESPDPNAVPERKLSWHTRMKSIGPPPIKTEKGWLVFYHAYGAHYGRYELGALLLDLNEPHKVLHRAICPVLSPDKHYENQEKSLIYACGAVVEGDLLYIYYGGADRVVCVAFTALAPFLDALVAGETPELSVEPARTR